jgi:tRNA A-37 threonylcarbamoyl transferase component Bud32
VSAPAPHPNDDIPVQPGQVLAGKYRVDRVLGRGGMGVVVEARHVQLEERVALKFLLPDYAQVPEASARFLREARAAVKIKSEHVARVSDVGTLETGAPYMVMEFLEGIDLSKALERYGVCQIPDAVDYLLQTCEAIAEAHGHGIVHRDLKPANLFLTRRPDGTPMIKVLDFGISKMAGSGVDNLTRTTTSMGSALYMSPEQMQTTRGVDHRTDIYALGISLYELLAGKQPYYADTLPQLCAEVLTGTPTPIRQLRADVPEGLGAVLEKAYARDREVRYQTIAELCAGLAPWAPVRSQNTLDRIARMAGVAPPVAGAAARPTTGSLSGAMPAVAPAALTGSQPNMAISGSSPAIQYTTGPAAQTGNHLAATPPPAQAAPQAVAQTGNHAYSPHDALAIGGYHGPMSEKAAAAFAAGASTNTNLSSTGAMPRAPSRTGLFVAIAVLAVALLALGTAFLFVRGRTDTPSPAGSVTASDSPSPAPTATLAAPPTATVSAPPTAEPTAAPTAAPTAEPTASTTAAVSPSGAPSTKPKTPATKPTGSAKKPGVMTSR